MDGADRTLVEGVLEAYRSGCFPMAEGRDAAERGLEIAWYRPDPRAVLPIRPELFGLSGGVRIPRRLARTVRSGRFIVTSDRAFARVVAECAAPRADSPGSSSETWIDARIEGVFNLLHEAGHAHSIEAWVEGEDGGLRLVGGLYGLCVGASFCAESMFSRPERGGRDASKACLAHLVRHGAEWGFAVIDVQFTNPHLEQFGVVETPIDVYLAALESGDVSWGVFADPFRSE